MATNFDRIPRETLIEKIINEQEDINDIIFSKKNQREVLVAVLEKRPNLIANVNSENAGEFLPYVVEKNKELFVYLKKEQFTNELAQMYLSYRFEHNDKKDTKNVKKDAVLVQKSIDDKLVFIYSYVTPEGEELNYFDNELNIPLSLRSSFKISLKLDDAIRLINKLDLHVAHLGENKIRSTIVDLISNRYTKFVTNYIKDHKLGYYSLMTSLGDIEAGFADVIESTFAEYGLSVSSFIIQKIAIPTDIKHKIEDLAFTIRQRKVDAEADSEIEKISLKNYESKLAVQQKFPDTVHSLTEYEKDLALKRYLIKVGKLDEEEIDHSINLKAIAEKVDSPIDVKEDIIPEQQKSKFKPVFFLSALMALISSIIIMSEESLGIGLITLGVLVIIFGLIAAFNRDKFLSKKSNNEGGNN